MELRIYSTPLLLLLLLSSHGHGLRCTEGSRALHFQLRDPPKIGEGEAVAEALIGSRPPRCEGKCAPCGRCEAVQVPVAPRVDSGSRGDAEPGRAAGDRVEDSYTDYKPLNWKCRCADRRALDRP
ncbi:hypothetical protein BS78_01G097100 [Paspalum vaginatum]|nr:hypothetical protein BS78_01G097100 [Paspalum vaginatum]